MSAHRSRLFSCDDGEAERKHSEVGSDTGAPLCRTLCKKRFWSRREAARAAAAPLTLTYLQMEIPKRLIFKPPA